jgi:glycosyltransferase involved in cell wall biosynthesis
MSNPFVSVIISAYKSEKYISQAIESVLNQT